MFDTISHYTMNVQNAQAAAAPLPVSAQTIAKFSDLFSDANKDPLQGLYHDLFASFDIDINNAQNGVPPASLRDFIAAAEMVTPEMINFMMSAEVASIGVIFCFGTTIKLPVTA